MTKTTTTLNGRASLRKYLFPKILSKNFERRIELLDEARENVHLQEQLYSEAARDITFYFNYFLWTFNPKVEPNHFPFLLKPVQRDLALKYQEEIRGGFGSLTEKSREVGATYIALGTYLHEWSFGEGFEALLLSMREDEVDNPTPSSLFGKLRYMTGRLPFWLLPRGMTKKILDKFLVLKNPDNGNSIVGMATTPEAGRSGRKKAVLVDEYAWIQPRILRGLETALQETTNCIHRISTPKGINQFKAVRDRKICRVHTIHWTRIPEKRKGLYYIDDKGKKIKCDDLPVSQMSPYGYYVTAKGRVTKFLLRSPWYDKKCGDYLTERDVNQELNIRYLGSGYCRFDTDMIQDGTAQTRDGKRGYLLNTGTTAAPVPKWVESESGDDFDLEVWTFPTKPYYHGRSVVCADVAEGLEKGDYSSADVLQKDVWKNKTRQAASLHGHWTPDVFAEKLVLLALWYEGEGQEAEIAVERNKDGLGVLSNIRNVHNYVNIFKGDDDKDGFLTKQSNKFTITGDLDEALRSDELEIYSIAHYTELSMFENNNGKLGATGSNFDDRVMDLSIGWHVIKQYGRPKQVSIESVGDRKKLNNFDTSKY